MALTSEQQDLVSRQIQREFRLKRRALAKRRAGKKLSPMEERRIRRTRAQNVAIGFSKARKIDDDIPEDFEDVKNDI